MNNTITSRLELLLAKIAGHDVDIKTMTPGVASNLSEKLMLEIADRLDNMSGGGGGSSDDFVINATITGQGEEPNTYLLDIGETTIAEISAAVAAEKNVRLLISGDGSVNNFVFCMGAEGGFLFYMLVASGSDEPPSAAFAFVSSDECAMFVSELGGGGVEKFVVDMVNNNGTWAPDGGVTVQDVMNAFNAGKICECHVPYDQNETVNLELVSCSQNSGTYFVRFSGVYHRDRGDAAVVAVAGVYGNGSTDWSVVTTDLASREKIFSFEIADDGAGVYTVTPGYGATYANISAALLLTPCVYAIMELPDNSGQIIGTFTFVDDYAVEAVGFNYTGGLTYHHIDVGSDGICSYHTDSLVNTI